MPFALSFLAPFLPYIIAGLGAVIAYFGIKHKGKVQAQEEFQHQLVQAEQKLQEKIIEATSQDAKIDQKVQDEKHEIRQEHVVKPDATGTFRF